MIEVKDLVKRYGNHLAVDHLSFTVEKGQIYGFLGPNGAGKSTTMNIITGYIASTEGTVLVDGHDIRKEPEAAKRCIGYLPEQPPLYFDMTVLEYLRFVAELKRVKKSERDDMVEQVMEMTGITPVAGRMIGNLSKGFRQRVGLAQALVGFPEILILDEPTVGLDPKQMIEIRELIRELSKDHTVILSSHILSEVSAVCDHILIISKGRLAASDTPENLSRTMAGAQKLSLLVKGTEETVMELLQGADQTMGIAGYQTEPSGEAGVLSVSLTAEPERDIREAVFFLMADAGFPILEMKAAGRSLEDVFLELTQDGGEQPEERETGADSEYPADNEYPADDEYPADNELRNDEASENEKEEGTGHEGDL